MDFTNPNYYDVADITDDMPNKPLLIELYKLMNEQNERLWMFFEDIDEDAEHKAMKLEFVKPRQHRASAAKRRSSVERKRAEQEADERGYKNFLKEEGLTELL